MRVFRGNGWNRFIYAIWSPVYDLLVGFSPLARARARGFELLSVKPGEEILLVGVGTGADFLLLPEGVKATGVDLSAAMLGRARGKLPLEGREVTLQVGDALDLPYEEERFDVTVMTLILSVVRDGRMALREAVRVTRSGGRLLVFDKFLAEGKPPSPGRRLLNLLTSIFGTDINRSFESMVAGMPCQVVCDERSLFSGAYRAIILEKTKD